MNLKYSIITGRALLIGLIILTVWFYNDLEWEIFISLLTFCGLALISTKGLLTKAYYLFQRDFPPSSKWYHNKYLIYILLIGPGLPIIFFLMWHTPNIRYALKRQISVCIFILIALFLLFNHATINNLNKYAYIRTTTLYKSPYPYTAFDGSRLYVIILKDAPEVFFWVMELSPLKGSLNKQTEYYVFKDIISFSSQHYQIKNEYLAQAVKDGLKSPEFWNETISHYRIKDGEAYSIQTGDKLEYYLGKKEKLPDILSVREVNEKLRKNSITNEATEQTDNEEGNYKLSNEKVSVDYTYEGSWISSKDIEPIIPMWQIEKNESSWSPGNVLALYFKNEIINDTIKLIFQYKDGSGRGWPMRLIYPEENSLFAKCYKIGNNRLGIEYYNKEFIQSFEGVYSTEELKSIFGPILYKVEPN